MSDTKISALTALTTATTDDIFPVVDDPGGTPVTKKITLANVLASLGTLGKFPFPATQVASAGANDLDDYEEGTWTPTVNTISLSSAAGTYTKVGRMVYAEFLLQFPSTADTTAFQIKSLPFAADGYHACAFGNNGGQGTMYGELGTGTTTISVKDGSALAKTNNNYSTQFVTGGIVYKV